jgi:transposase
MKKQLNTHCFKLLAIFGATLFFNSAHTQILKKIKKGLQDARTGAREVQATAVEVGLASKTVDYAVKSIKATWKKDTSSNIRYQQVPDYRTREEVKINRTQKISIENGQFKNLAWEPVIKFENQVFPSFVIGWATYNGIKEEDMGSSLGFTISTSLTGVVLKWEIESADKGYFDIDSGYINCDEIKYTRLFMPRIAWNFKALAKRQTSAPLNVYFRLIDPNTGNKVERLVNINLRSINDCMTYYNGKNFSYLFVSYINEDHPAIDTILKQMLNTKMIDAVLGYQAGPGYVELQVAALWRVLHDRGFQYSSITDNSGDSDSKGLFSQTVRTLDNSLKTSQSNCVDGTVVFASILKRIGLRPVMVTVPRHCFLGYYADDTTTTNIRFLETVLLSDDTYLTNPKVSVQKNSEALAQLLPKSTKFSELNKAYYLEFLKARSSATATFEKNLRENPQYVKFLIVNDLRKSVKPIPVYTD